MSNLCTYEDLMPKIQALVAPPDKSSAGTSKERSAPETNSYFKRRGKRHDYCDACGERGNVLFCANCPASFHPLCHDPPITEKKISTDQWICNSCVFVENKNQQKVAENPPQRNSHSRRTSAESVEMATVTNAVKPVAPTSDNFPFSGVKDTLSVVLHDSIVIKNESIEEENVGSELDESSDAGSVGNMPIKMESRDEDELLRDDLVFPLKTEPEAECFDSAAEDDAGDVNGLNMDDVWKILGINKQVKVNTVKESGRKTSANSDNSVSKDTSDLDIASNCVEEAKRKQIHINLTNCDYMLKNRKNDAVIEVDNKNKNKKRPAPKPKRNRRPKAVDHVTGIQRAFADMITDASKANPKQFSLPAEYVANIDMNLISTEKDADNLANDLDSRDLLKLPARKCYYCKGTCLVGQIISCDFCPAHFHLNCLNPPLCTIPDVKWMCPLHPHHVLERVMKNPSSITELMSWWSKFSVPIDDEDIKSNFIEKIKSHDKKPKSRPFINASVKIPDIVKYHYKRPPPRIPPLEELLPSKATSNDNFTSAKYGVSEKTNSQEPSGTTSHAESESLKNTTTSESAPSTSQAKNSSDKKYNLRPYKKVRWKSLLDMTSNERTSSKKTASKTKIPDSEPSPNSDITVDTKESSSNSNEIYQNGTSFATAKMIQKVDTTEANLSWKKIENYIIRDINKNFITGGISITTLSEDIRRVLMIQRIKQLTEDLPPSFSPNSNPYPLFHPLLKDNLKDTLPERPKGNVRAVLCPLSHRPLIYMYGQSLSIGLGFSNDVCLRNYGNCNFISEDHAVIFYDKVTNTYELINYSKYNTIVDGVCYTCDISHRHTEKSIPTTSSNPPPAPKSPTKPVRKKSIGSSSSVPRNGHSKRTASTVKAAEARSTYKRLLNDIDKLVSKSKQEMATIADEDLNEISKAIKNTPAVAKPDVQAGAKRVQRTKRNATKRKPSDMNDDQRPTKITRISKPSSSQTADTEDVSRPNEGRKIPRTRSGTTSKRVTKPTRSRTSIRPETGSGSAKKTTQTKSSNEKPLDQETNRLSHLPNDLSDDEYLLGDNFFVNPKRTKCQCQSNHQKFPNGRDESWERTAPLNHGSYIQFGCIKFIFSIVNYPAPREERSYIVAGPNPPPVRALEPHEFPPNGHHSQNNDLTSKLMSILNNLSDQPPANVPNSIGSRPSSPLSPLSTRSCSPALQNGHVSRPESPVDGHIEITG